MVGATLAHVHRLFCHHAGLDPAEQLTIDTFQNPQPLELGEHMPDPMQVGGPMVLKAGLTMSSSDSSSLPFFVAALLPLVGLPLLRLPRRARAC